MQTTRLNRPRTHSLAIALGLASLLAQSAVAQNFTVTLEPSSVTLIPTKTAAFVVSLIPLGGFSSEVSLAVETLPAGVTAEFSSNPVTLPGSALLTLRADANAAVGSFALNVIASGGGITNNSAGTVNVQFGLLPLCTGAFQGTVIDVETGLPVPGAEVRVGNQKQLSDAAGHYFFTNLSLSTDNKPASYSLQSSRTDYWHSAFISAWAICDTTNTVDLPMLRQRFGSISGTVVLENGQPAANVEVCAKYACTNTDANGAFQFGSLTLDNSNAPAIYGVRATANGYWPASMNTNVTADNNSVVSLVLTQICTATLTGRVYFADTMLPAANRSGWVTENGSSKQYDLQTDANGYYGISGLPLAAGNTPVFVNISIPASGNYMDYYKQVQLTNCSQVLLFDCYIPPRPHYNYGALAGHILDETGLPVPNASVSISAYAMSTGGRADASGAYFVTNLNVGMSPATSYQGSVSASAAGYYSSGYSNVTILANQVVTQDVRVLRMRYGAIAGLVRDSETHIPIANASISPSGSSTVRTGPDGRYITGPLSLAAGNGPAYAPFTIDATNYWSISTNTTVRADTTNIVDVDLLKICNGATIAGTVVNALTQQPITNATISGVGTAHTDGNGSFVITGIASGKFNSPRQVTLTASAPGFNSQSQTVSIFCGAAIIVSFGAPQTVFGAIEGFVTNALTGTPLADVFIGSQFGGGTTTDTNGYYRLEQAPLGANGADRTWTVTAMPNGFASLTKSVVVSSNITSRLDFGFGQPSALLTVSATAAPNPVAVGSNLLYTITLQNTGTDASNVQLKDTLPASVTFLNATVSTSSGDFFTTPTYSNHVITTTTSNFSSNSVAVLSVSVRPETAGSLTNIASVTSETPDLDVTGSNRTAVLVTTVTGPATRYADLVLSLAGVPNPILVSNQIAYTLFVTNAGPDDAPGVTVDDTLPTTVNFVSATASQGSTTRQGAMLHWEVGPLAQHASATATFVVVPIVPGSMTNKATLTLVSSGGALITDTNLANNSAALVTTASAPATTNVSVQVLGPIIFNRQTGLYEQPVQFNNLSGGPVNAVRISLNGLPADVVLYNASGSGSGTPFVQYDQTVPGGGSVRFLLEYYRSNRLEFGSPDFSATAVEAAAPPEPSGTVLQLDRSPFLSNGSLVIEFASTPGATYVVQYSSDLQIWKSAVPPMVAAGTSVQWADAGPPKTDSPPGSPGQRFYRILRLP